MRTGSGMVSHHDEDRVRDGGRRVIVSTSHGEVGLVGWLRSGFGLSC